MSDAFINILIAEDNVVSRNMMAQLLETQGFRVIHAGDGDEAMDLLHQHAIDLAIVDINMSPTGGFAFMRYVVARGYDVPVVIVTGDDSSDLLMEASALGVMRVLQKPVQPKRLQDTVIHILKKRGLNPEPMGVETFETKFSGDEVMLKTIALAEKNYKSGKGGPYGAIVTDKDGKIIGEGVNGIASRCDPTAHAEVMAIRQAAEKLGRADLGDCTLYVSSEPTLMGKALVISVGIPKVYFGLSHDEIKSMRQSEEKVRQAIVDGQAQAEAVYEQRGHEEAMDMFQGWMAQNKGSDSLKQE